MSGKTPRVNPLLARRQMLVATSELNRAALINDLTTLHHEVSALTKRAKLLGTIASVVGVLLAGLTRGNSPSSGPKISWLPKVLGGTEIVTKLWRVFRPQPKVPPKK